MKVRQCLDSRQNTAPAAVDIPVNRLGDRPGGALFAQYPLPADAGCAFRACFL